MDRIDIQEKILGGVFGVIAIVAAIAEMFANGADTATILGMIKDVAGTLVVVVVMISVARLLRPKKEEKTFEEKLEGALSDWVENHSNMVVRTSKMPKGHEHDYGMSMTTDISRFYDGARLTSDAGKGVGRFLRVTEVDRARYAANDVEMEFFINAQTYCNQGATPEETIAELLEVGGNLSKYVATSCDGVNAGAPRKLDARTVVVPVTFKRPIVSGEGDDIALMICTIDRMYEAMLVSARRK